MRACTLRRRTADCQGKGRKTTFPLFSFCRDARHRDFGICQRGSVCSIEQKEKGSLDTAMDFFFVNFSVVQCTVVVRGVASRFSVPCSLRGFRLNRIQHPLIDFSRNGTHETLLRWKETLIREFAGRSFFFPRNGLQFQRNALARETFRDKTEGRNSGRET